MRTLISVDPLIDSFDNAYNFDASPWPAKWIGPGEHASPGPGVLAFRRTFTVKSSTTVRLHVTADQRYQLLLDGTRIGAGSERGDLNNWFYETYDVPLTAGRHVLVAQVWWLGDHAPIAQISARSAFLLLAEGPLNDQLSTGVATWDVAEVKGYSFTSGDVPGAFGVGARTHIDGTQFPWGVERGVASIDWHEASVIGPAAIKRVRGEAATPWKLRPAILPEMAETTLRVGAARYVADVPSLDVLGSTVVRERDSSGSKAAAWTAMLQGKGPSIAIPKRTVRRVIVDLENYYCAYGDLIVTGGHGALVRTLWAESLFVPPRGTAHPTDKSNRDQIEGKLFFGMGGSFLADGGTRRTFTPLWFDAGRYIAIDIATADEPLTIESFTLRSTGYPFEFTARFDASDPRLPAVVPTALHSLQMCSHETYMDCPYYEQMMYVGDTRLETLVTYVSTSDDRLPRKAIEMFDASRDADGWTQSRYPSRAWQRIPPFSLWWVCMVHDYAMWRNDPSFVADRMPGVRAVLEAARRSITADGLFTCPHGWNFQDWASGHQFSGSRGWDKGIPPGGTKNFGVKGPINWQAVLAFQAGAALETIANQPELAARNTAAATRIATAAEAAFWDESRGLLADDADHHSFSEHSQCLATLAGTMPAVRQARAMTTLLDTPPADLVTATIYFRHYVFEACRLAKRPDGILNRLNLWFDLPKLGLKTTLESPEPSRSDCHAWGAHPVFHFHASILGVRPSKPGFAAVRIEPQLGTLAWAKGAMPHPAGGVIECDLKQDDGRVSGTVGLPKGLQGDLVVNDVTRPITSGQTTL